MSDQLPIGNSCAGLKTEGFCTPQEDKTVQKMKVPPRKVIPVILLPGIMGSNLRMNAARQKKLGRANNIAWRPDRTWGMKAFINALPELRQDLLDPLATEVDVYEPNAPTGNKSEKARQRHRVGRLNVDLDDSSISPLLTDDPPTASPRARIADKVLRRGWGEVFFGSYRKILEECEQCLNSPISADCWQGVLDTNPAKWCAVPPSPSEALTQDELIAAVKGCFFPVHAMGYNWLTSNSESAKILSRRVADLIGRYQSEGYQCEKVILITHSMGGLVARALVHPNIGALSEKILGVVHGVMPANGAPAAYKRMRCGFEERWLRMHPVPKILGNFGDEVTAVLGNAPGGLQLLPSKAYGNGWLKVRQGKVLFDSFPKNGDPYEEIYKLKGRWYGLLREEWLNPAGHPHAGAEWTSNLLDLAKEFHEEIAETYHPCSYAHYGVDTERPSWASITWNLDHNVRHSNWHMLRIAADNRQGQLELLGEEADGAVFPERVEVTLGISEGAGDETVPMLSADHQRQSGKFTGIFQQSGYEHQDSYSNENVIRATIYCIVKIAGTMQWSSQ